MICLWTLSAGQIKRSVKTNWEMITEVGITLAEVTLELEGSFTLEMHYIPFYTCQLSRVTGSLTLAD